MKFHIITSEILSHNSYFIGSGNTAAVIDPRRDCDAYLDLARRYDMSITHIFETHRNEDYITGAPELAALCGAGIYHGSKLDFGYGKQVKDGDLFKIGSLEIDVMETPGHTLESISLLLRDREISDRVYMIFTGDALFAGDVGRTDLAGPPVSETSAMLYDSIFGKILPAGDGVIICPAHGAGSVCGAAIGDQPFTTIGYEKQVNPHLQRDRDAFIEYKIGEHHYRPPYFSKMEELNLNGPPVPGRIPAAEPIQLNRVKELISGGAQVVDIRPPTSFAGGHISGSLNIWRNGLPAFMGWFLNYEDPIIVVDDLNPDMDSVARHFVRLGYDNFSGYLSGGFSTWFRSGQEFSKINTWSVHDLMDNLNDPSLFLLDVRDIQNRNKIGSINGAYHIYAGELPDHLEEVPEDLHVVVYCDAGFKGSLAASILKRNGYLMVTNVLGGMRAWTAAGYPVEK